MAGRLGVLKAWGRPLRMVNRQVRFRYHIKYPQDDIMSSVCAYTPTRSLPQWKSTCAVFLANIYSIHCHHRPELDTAQRAERASPAQGVMKQCLPVSTQVPNLFLEKCTSIFPITVPNYSTLILPVCQDSYSPWITTVLRLKHRSNPSILWLPFYARQMTKERRTASLTGLLQIVST